jgi:hypothetical protein
MTAKEAWVFCRALCEAEGIEAPTLRTFKWYLQHGAELASEMVPDPFGSSHGEKIHSIAAEEIEKFATRLREKGALEVVVAAAEPEASDRTTAASAEPTKTTPKKQASDRELDIRQALSYLHNRVGKGCELNHTTFGFYLAYDLIPSKFQGRLRVVRQGDLEAFIELAPSGVYANHLPYETEMDRARGDMVMTEAYAYYSDVDPNPVALNSFRSLVAVGIIRPIRTANDPKAPVLGFKKQEIDGFLAIRQRMLEATKDQPEASSAEGRSVVAKVIEEVLERSKPQIEAAKAARASEERKTVIKVPQRKRPQEKPKSAPKGAPAEVALQTDTEDRWVPISAAYDHYVSIVERPFSFSWFRVRVYKSDVFASRVRLEDLSNNPTGKVYLVDLRSVDAYAATLKTPKSERAEKTKPKPALKGKAWPVEKAYHKFRGVIPPGLSLLQFKRLVRDKLISSFVRGDVVHVHETSVANYFGQQPEVDRSKPMGRVTLSIKNYPSATEMRKALRLLTEQGFNVEVIP